MKFAKFNKTLTKGKGGKNKPPAGRVLEHDCRFGDNDRVRGNECIKPERTHLNYDLAESIRNGQSAMERYHEKLEQAEKTYQERNGKALRKDTVTICAWTITAPKDLPEDKLKDFFKYTYEYMINTYGKDNTISANVHMDETTPHMHYNFMPFVEDKKNGGLKLCAKGLESPLSLKSMHIKLQQFLEEKLGCEVNLLNGTTKGGEKTVEQLKSDTLKADNDLLKSENERLRETNEKLTTENEELQARIDKGAEVVARYTPETTKIKKTLFGNKEVPKTKEEIELDEKMLAAQLVISMREEVEHQKQDNFEIATMILSEKKRIEEIAQDSYNLGFKNGEKQNQEKKEIEIKSLLEEKNNSIRQRDETIARQSRELELVSKWLKKRNIDIKEAIKEEKRIQSKKADDYLK